MFGNEDEVYYHPDIDNWPYIGENNVMGGGGQHQEAEMPVPPTANLYSSGLSSVPGYDAAKGFFTTPYPLIVGLLVGAAIMFVVMKFNVVSKATAQVKKIAK